jgi:hypothetical protein
MARYGNILSLYNSSSADVNNVINVLQTNQVIHQQVEQTFFIETTSKDNTKAVVKGLTDLNIPFTFFHDGNPNRSYLFSNNMDPEVIAMINKILFE